MRSFPALARRGRGLIGLMTGLMMGLLLATQAAAQGAPDFPPLTGRVVDQANLLSPQTEQALTEKLAALEAESSDQLVVVTLNSLQDQEIEDYGYRLGRAWGIGQSENDNGALLIVAPNERKVRIEVGYGLEPILTDAFSSLVIQNEILPSFRQGDFEGGIVKGVDALVMQLSLDPAEAEARAAAVEVEKPGVPVVALVIVGLVFLFIFMGVIGSLSGGRRHRRDGVTPILIWAASEALKNSSRGGRGGWGGGGFGGGGFGGGGGGFGGGGASGGW